MKTIWGIDDAGKLPGISVLLQKQSGSLQMSGLQGFAGSPQTTDWDIRLRARVRENNAPIRNEDIVSYDTLTFSFVADNCQGPKTRLVWLVLSKVYIISSYIIRKTLASDSIMTLVLKALCRAAMLIGFLGNLSPVKSWMRPIRKQFLPVANLQQR